MDRFYTEVTVPGPDGGLVWRTVGGGTEPHDAHTVFEFLTDHGLDARVVRVGPEVIRTRTAEDAERHPPIFRDLMHKVFGDHGQERVPVPAPPLEPLPEPKLPLRVHPVNPVAGPTGGTPASVPTEGTPEPRPFALPMDIQVIADPALRELVQAGVTQVDLPRVPVQIVAEHTEEDTDTKAIDAVRLGDLLPGDPGFVAAYRAGQTSQTVVHSRTPDGSRSTRQAQANS